MRPAPRKLALVTLLAGACLLASLRTSQAGGSDPSTDSRAPRRAPVTARPDRTELLASGITPGEHWFLSQRAYPGPEIPEGAHVRALRATERVPAFAPREPGAKALPSSAWSLVGPAGFDSNVEPTWGRNSGRVRALAIDPTNVNRMFLGAATGGVWGTTDGGASWTPLTDQEDSLAVGAIAIAPSAPDTIYVGTGEGNGSYYSVGILKSTNGGTTWTKLAESTFSRGRIAGLAVDPGDPSTVLACAQGGGPLFGGGGNNAVGGIYRSTNGGTSFTVTSDIAFCNELAVDPSSFSVMYYSATGAGDANGIYKSTNAGLTWTRLEGANAPVGAGVGALSIGISANGQTLYVGGAVDGGVALLKSTNAGASFTVLGPTTSDPSGFGGDAASYCESQCDYDNVVLVSPSSSSEVWLGGIGLYRSTNGGASFTQLGTNSGGGPMHVDHHVMRFQPGNSSVLFDGNDGGIWKTSNSGGAWTSLNGTLATLQAYQLSLDPANAAIMFAGFQDNGVERRTASNTWTEVFGGDGTYTAIDFVNPLNVYAAAQELGLGRSPDRGATWFEGGSGLPDKNAERRNFVAPFVMDTASATTLYAGTYRLWRTTNGAGSWTARSGDLTGGDPNATVSNLAVSKSNALVLYAVTDNGLVQLSQDAGQNFTNVTKAPLPNRYATCVAIDPANAAVAYVGYSGFDSNTPGAPGHVFKTVNSGTSWTNLTGNLPDVPVNALAIRPDNTAELYAGTDTGVFISNDGGSTWARMNNGMPKAPVTWLSVNATTNRLVAATFGRSIWSAEIVPSGPTGGCCNGTTCTEEISQATCEAGGGVYTGDGTNCGAYPCPSAGDRDGDGVPDTSDNCQMYANPPQLDANANGKGDICEFAWGDIANSGGLDGIVSVVDLVRMLSFVNGRSTPTPVELKRANVAPATIVTGSPEVATPTLEVPLRVQADDVDLATRVALGLTVFSQPY